MISAGYPSGNCCLDNYIPVTYPTGHLWNPYPFLLGEADVWPKGFPTELKKEPQQESLNGAMEMVPSASIGLIQFQGGRTWQAFGGGKHGHETFRQARNYNFRDKCVVFARNLKFSILTQ